MSRNKFEPKKSAFYARAVLRLVLGGGVQVFLITRAAYL